MNLLKKVLFTLLSVVTFSVAANAQLITVMDAYHQGRHGCPATVTAFYECGGCGSGTTAVTQILNAGDQAVFPSTCGTPTNGWVLYFSVDYGNGPTFVDLDPCSFISSTGSDFAIDCFGIPQPFAWVTSPVIWVPGTVGNVHLDLY